MGFGEGDVMCLVCNKRQPFRPYVCDSCRARIDKALWELGKLYPLLPYAKVAVSGHGEPVSGSREPRVPINVDALDLVAPSRPGTVSGELQDQLGQTSIPTVLALWLADWCGLPEWELPTYTMPFMLRKLGEMLPAACDSQDLGIAEFAGEIFTLLGNTKRLLNLETKSYWLKVLCPDCEYMTVIRNDDDYLDCLHCHRLWRDSEYLAQHYELPYDLMTGRIDIKQAAELADVSEDVIRQWKARKHLVALRKQTGERGPRFRPLDVLVMSKSRQKKVTPITLRAIA